MLFAQRPLVRDFPVAAGVSHQLRALAAVVENTVRFPEHKWQLTICNTSSRRPEGLFGSLEALGAHVVHICTNTHTHKKINL